MRYRGKRHRNPDNDSKYLGSGTLIKRAIEKYGRDNFQKDIIFQAFDEESVNWAESFFVDQEWVDRKDTYNLTPGGIGISSRLASELSQKRIADGNHNFKVSEFQKKNAQRRLDAGIHHFQGEHGSVFASNRNKKLAELGMHPFQDIEKQKERSKKRINDGTHNFLNSEMQRKTAIKRVETGTHPLLGKGMMTVIEIETKNYKRITKDEYFAGKGTKYIHPRSAKNKSDRS